jgi:hypothetical protein
MAVDKGMLIRISANVEAAKREIAGLGSSIQVSTEAMRKLAAGLEGNKLLQRASEIVGAVNEIGGVTKLTTSEKERLNATLARAVEKYHVLGQEAPQAMRDLEEATRKVEQPTSSLEDRLKAVGTAVAAAFSFRELAGAAANAVEMTGRITDLATQVGISAEAVQELDFVAKLSGSTFDNIAGAITQMANRLVEGDKSAVGSLAAMNLSVEQLRAMAPDQAFETIAAAVAQITDPMERSKVAMDLFGKSGAQLLPVLTSDIGALRDAARESGAVISNDLVKAGDDLGDQWDLTQTKIKALMAQGMLPLLQTFTDLPAPMQTTLAVGANLAPMLSNVGMAVMAAGGPVAAMGMLTKALSSVGMLLTLPAGAVVAAIVGLVLVFQHWDEISAIAQRVYAVIKEWMLDKLAAVWTGIKDGVMAVVGFYKNLWLGENGIIAIAQRVYEGVKSWLVDKFNAIVDGIRQKVDAVKGFFKGMYDAVVGGSYVPDLINGIAQHFGRLNDIMVSPTMSAASGVMGIFQNLATSLPGLLQQAFSSGGGGLAGLLSNVLGGGAGGGLLGAGVTKGLTTMFNSASGTIMSVFGTGLSTALGMAIPGIGAALGPLLTKGLGAAWEGLKGLFGGPSKTELQGRDVAGVFRTELAGLMTDMDKLEAKTLIAQGNNAVWANTAVTVKNAYLAAGLSGEDALNAVDRLWKAEKQGGDAVRRVIEDIEAVMRGKLTPTTQTAVATGIIGFDKMRGQINELRQQAIEAGLITSIEALEAQMRDAAASGVTDFAFMTSAILVLKAKIAEPIIVPVTLQYGDIGRARQGEIEEAARMSDAQKAAAITDFLARNEGDRHRISEALGISGEDAARLGFQHGTRGQFLDFGRGTDIRVHGRERIVTEEEGRAEAGSFAALKAELAALRAEMARALRDLPRANAIALHDALVLGGAR